MPKLNVNIDHIATIREARRGAEPDPVHGAVLAELAGAHGIVVHLREDRRHIQDRDLYLLRQTVKTRLNMEMAATEEMVGIALDVKPDVATLVPEKRQELTTEGGLDVVSNFEHIEDAVGKLREAGIFVSLFIDPDPKQIKSAFQTSAEMCEIHTGNYAEASNTSEKDRALAEVISSVKNALDLGLRVSAGHGLNYQNVSQIAQIEGIEELNIGHSIISRSVLVGMEKAVWDMLELCI